MPQRITKSDVTEQMEKLNNVLQKCHTTARINDNYLVLNTPGDERTVADFGQNASLKEKYTALKYINLGIYSANTFCK